MPGFVLADAALRTALHHAPNRVRLAELDELFDTNPNQRLHIREQLENMEIDGEINRIAVGDHIVLKTTDEFNPPENPERYNRIFSKADPPWGAWYRRSKARSTPS